MIKRKGNIMQQQPKISKIAFIIIGICLLLMGGMGALMLSSPISQPVIVEQQIAPATQEAAPAAQEKPAVEQEKLGN
jgi:hypothetical protein